MSFKQRCIRFQEIHSKFNNYFYNASLSSTITGNFVSVLNILANVPYADVKDQVHWNLMNKNKKSQIQKSYETNIYR